MQSYKIAVSKNGKKYTIVFKAENELMARERVHKEWYSILSIEEVTVKDQLWNIFLFTAYNNLWELKQWKIVWEDIFKVYVKLTKNLEYKVTLLFSESDKDFSQEDKQKILKNLEEEYNLFNSWKKEDKLDKLKEKIDLEKKEKKENDNFYMKKELEETYNLIVIVLQKLQNLLSWEAQIELDYEQKEKLKNIYNSIIKFKKSTNISKLKEIWELALLKIWKIELDELEKKHKDINKDLLKETNSLLRKIWSKESFIEKDKDVKQILLSFVNKISTFFSYLKYVKEDKNNIDKHSHSYIKNILFLKKYKEKLKENNIFILKNLISFILNSEKRTDILIRRKVIKQNITLFTAKEKWVWFSYTFVKKWFWKILEAIISFIKGINDYLFIVVTLYTILFVLYLNINYYYNITASNYDGIFYFLVIFFIHLILYFSRNLFLIILNFVILFFIIIFWVVNF